jgi:hypothetical protein
MVGALKKPDSQPIKRRLDSFLITRSKINSSLSAADVKELLGEKSGKRQMILSGIQRREPTQSPFFIGAIFSVETDPSKQEKTRLCKAEFVRIAFFKFPAMLMFSSAGLHYIACIHKML